MFDVFTEEIEIQIKTGISNLYWYRGDLQKSWLRAGVQQNLVTELFIKRNDDGTKLTKRQLMDLLYNEIRNHEYNRRLEISRNFVRFLTEHKNFVPNADGHKIQIAETCSLKLKSIIENQKKQIESNQQIRARANSSIKNNYNNELLILKTKFLDAEKLTGQDRGYAFEKVFNDLMRISEIPIEKSFKIEGEQIDGGIKYDGHFYIVELKWTKSNSSHSHLASLYMKVEGKMEARGIFISMNGYSKEILESLPKGKSLNMLLLDGNHIANVIFGLYTFKELLEHSIVSASLKGRIYCSHNL